MHIGTNYEVEKIIKGQESNPFKHRLTRKILIKNCSWPFPQKAILFYVKCIAEIVEHHSIRPTIKDIELLPFFDANILFYDHTYFGLEFEIGFTLLTL